MKPLLTVKERKAIQKRNEHNYDVQRLLEENEELRRMLNTATNSMESWFPIELMDEEKK